jgi:hypothetical protein
MLSNTDDSAPRLNAVCHEGSGRPFSGISDADATSATRNTAPLAPWRITDQSGLAMRLVTRIAAHKAMPSQGAISSPLLSEVARTLAVTAAARMKATIQIRRHSSG